MASAQPVSSERPTVVIVRPTGIDTDSRAKKIGVSLARLGYGVTVLGRSSTARPERGRVGDAEVLMVPARSHLRGAPQRVLRLPSFARPVEAKVNRGLQRAEQYVNKRLREDRLGHYLWWRSQRDFRTTYGSELVRMQPDVIHVHDPRLLPVAAAAARRIMRRSGKHTHLVYDAREDFAGWAADNIPLPAYHRHRLRAERRAMRQVELVLTVGDETAKALAARLPLRKPPVVLLNAPVAGRRSASRSLRADIGVGDAVPLLAYPGAATKPRGVDTLVEALPLLPQVHVALVVVPYPHPREQEVRELAARLGVADRLHIVAPVDADSVAEYLSGADVVVSTILTGSPNHEAALPNKLFEMVHSGRPIVTTNVRAMSSFVVANKLGLVYRSGDASDLARAVREVLADPSPWTEPQRRAELIRTWSWQAQEDRLAAAYHALIPTAAPRASGAYPMLEPVWC